MAGNGLSSTGGGGVRGGVGVAVTGGGGIGSGNASATPGIPNGRRLPLTPRSSAAAEAPAARAAAPRRKAAAAEVSLERIDPGRGPDPREGRKG